LTSPDRAFAVLAKIGPTTQPVDHFAICLPVLKMTIKWMIYRLIGQFTSKTERQRVDRGGAKTQ
jgi:hypothetical protein